MTLSEKLRYFSESPPLIGEKGLGNFQSQLMFRFHIALIPLI